MKSKAIAVVMLVLMAVGLTSCELPKGPDPDTMGSATRMMMGLPPKERENKSKDDVTKILGLGSLMIMAGGITKIIPKKVIK